MNFTPERPTWDRILSEWRNYKVPSVEIIPFQFQAWKSSRHLGKHSDSLPWFDKEEKCQWTGVSNPQIDTARHLCVVLHEKSEDLVAAYKLLAICKENKLNDFAYEVLPSVFQFYGFDIHGWRDVHARYLLPPVFPRTSGIEYMERHELQDWHTLVKCAAQEWISVAQNWAIVRIPDFMDRVSSEYKQYEEYVRQVHEERERAEHERLKRKFE